MNAAPKPASPDIFSGTSKFSLMREILNSGDLAFLMEAHDGISAKIVEEAGFKGIWASGLSMSAALGVRDSNEASWTQVLEVLEFMSDATSIPILVDGDTGYGNFNNMRRAVQKLCQRQIGGICIEDKLFPKTNSFIGEGQPLADIDEFCGKIKAGKDSQSDDDFCIIARVEALISGWGMEEAIKRAEAYHAAGADGILIHSKRRDADEILTFLKEWKNRCPVVIVPTTYYSTPTEEFEKAGTSVIIWANHNIRASIAAMRETSRRIMRDQNLMGVEDQVASVQDIFNLAENDELAEAEKRYLPITSSETRAIILAASRGEELGGLTEHLPKCMIEIRGQPLLRRLVTTLNQEKIRKIIVVRGFEKDKVNLPSLDYIDNDRHGETGEAATLAAAETYLEGDCIVAYGDILFRHYILEMLAEAAADVTLVVDALWQERDSNPQSRIRDLVKCSDEFHPGFVQGTPVKLERISHDLTAEEINGEWIGLARFSEKGSEALRATLANLKDAGSLDASNMSDVFNKLVDGDVDVQVLYITGHWLDVDNPSDLEDAQRFL
ncbi:MAG: phosphoenolpyruvate mutase [Rhodospirillales bacterium]|nr:phosphoenolpyruvate mutase [Rhodospirillales bacterium]